MKTIFQGLLACLCVSSAQAEFRTWTRSDGKTAELELVGVSDVGGEKSGDFKHGVTGIPSVIVCELDGKMPGNYRDLAALEKLVK
jgi:hypothetical protein